MPKFKVYFASTAFGSAIIEAENVEAANHAAFNQVDGGEIAAEIDWADEYNADIEIDDDEETVQVCDECEGNPDSDLVEGKCSSCREEG